MGVNAKITPGELPPAQRHIVKRPRLTRLLDEAEARILLLVAPAGYGKTTLAREWSSSRGRQCLWLQVPGAAADPAVLARTLIRTASSQLPEVVRRIDEYVRTATDPDANVIAELVRQEPTEAALPILVVDDYQFASSTPSESIIEALTERFKRTLIASRLRPSWVDARRLLYGEAFELGQSALAMTHHEAELVLATARRGATGLVALANGWPAVIGLAALLPADVTPDVDLPADLHSYLAEELYSALDSATREAVLLLSLIDEIDAEIVRQVFGKEAQQRLADAVKRGFLTPARPAGFEMHPLARSFLWTRLPTEAEGVGQLIDRALEYLFGEGRWDNVFSVMTRTGRRDGIRRLFGEATGDLLGSGRSATLESWLSWASDQRVDGPELSWARGELALRRGDWIVAESLCLAAARKVQRDDLKARAMIGAARSAHLQDKLNRAREHFGRAIDLAPTSQEVARDALWGRFVSSLMLGKPAIEAAVRELEDLDDTTSSYLLRLEQARLIVAARAGDVSVAAETGLLSVPLLAFVADPLARSGFLNNLANLLVLAAHYDDAYTIATRELREAEEARLGFVIPNALLNIAAARLGQGDFAGALADIDRALGEDVEEDAYLLGNSAATRARVFLSRGDIESARETLGEPLPSGLRDDILGEVLATEAVVAACAGQLQHAKQCVQAAEQRMHLVDTKVLAAAARAIVALKSGDNLDAPLHAFASAVTETGNFDNAVFAFRAEPSLVDCAALNPALSTILAIAARRANDPSLAAGSGIKLSRMNRRGESPLTTREVEVLRLAAQGFRNSEIAGRLFISDKTVKTHLQHVYEKLRARSRTEAVVRATEAGYLR